MNIIDAILLGFVQGITEFIPVSSSGHLILTDILFSSGSTFEFDVLLNIGTIAALILYFRSKLISIYQDVIHKRDLKLAVNIVISTIPAAVFGFFLSDTLKSGSFRSTAVVALMLAIVGFLMVIEPRVNKSTRGKISDVSKEKALGIGFAQSLALIPGSSRSGVTILAGRFFGLSHKQAAEYSFLIAIPILTGALLKTLTEPETWSLINSSNGALFVGITTAFITGYFAIAVMLKFLQKHGLQIFGYYRIALALLLLLTLL